MKKGKGKLSELFLSRDSTVKRKEFDNIIRRHFNKEIKIVGVRLNNLKKEGNEKYFVLKEGDLVGITEDGLAFKFQDVEDIIPPELYDSIIYEIR